MNRKLKRKKKRIFQKTMILAFLSAFLLGVLCGRLVFAEKKVITETSPKAISKKTEEKIENNSETLKAEIPWNLVLVNAVHLMEEGYEPELAEIENNYMADVRIVQDLQEMLRDGRNEGMNFWICSAYRSMDKQTVLYENKVKRLRNEGMSAEQAQVQAKTEVAYPGTSEHQLGLAVDIVAKDYQLLDEKQANTKEAKWLEENCWRYGFILRYPLDKTEKTGIIFEPWHYRYVGREAAKEMMQQKICLEEYLEIYYGQ